LLSSRDGGILAAASLLRGDRRGGRLKVATTAAATIMDTARAFFDACDTGKGWEACSAHCHADATFAVQAEPLADLTTVKDYADWMKALLVFVPDGSYEMKAFGLDEERNSVCAYAVFSGTHSGEGGPMPPTGKSTRTDYVYAMDFEDGKIKHMTKIWNAGWAMKELGWA
jgi:predicted ester cyclase